MLFRYENKLFFLILCTATKIFGQLIQLSSSSKIITALKLSEKSTTLLICSTKMKATLAATEPGQACYTYKIQKIHTTKSVHNLTNCSTTLPYLCGHRESGLKRPLGLGNLLSSNSCQETGWPLRDRRCQRLYHPSACLDGP